MSAISHLCASCAFFPAEGHSFYCSHRLPPEKRGRRVRFNDDACAAFRNRHAMPASPKAAFFWLIKPLTESPDAIVIIQRCVETLAVRNGRDSDAVEALTRLVNAARKYGKRSDE